MKLRSASTLMLASSLTVMAGAMVAPSLPGLGRAFAHVDNVDLLARLVLTIPALAVVLGAPLVGWLVDRLGSRLVLVVGLVIYGAGGTSGLWLEDLMAILAGRFVLGLGVAAVMTAATTLIANLTHGPERGRFMGLQAAFMGLGGMLFLSGGGLLADVHWTYPFASYALAWLLVPAAMFTLPGPLPAAERVHTKVGIPTAVWGLYGAAFLAMALFYVAPVQLPFLLNENLDASGLAVGLALAIMTLAGTSASFSFPALHRRFGSPIILVGTFGIMAPGLALVGWAESWTVVLVGQATFGFGVGLVLPNLNLWVASKSPAGSRGRMLGGLNTAIFLGQFASPLIASPVLALGSSLGQLFLMCALTAALLAMGVAYLLLRPAPRPAV